MTDFEQEIHWAFTTGQAKMRSTTDTLTGKTFRWNMTVLCGRIYTPARCTDRVMTHLDPSRVRRELLVKLNGEDAVRDYEAGAGE